VSVRRVVRPAAYAVCESEGRVLLARWTGPRGPEWTLPGGGIDHGEDPRHAAVREVAEETGYEVVLDRLLTVDSVHIPEAGWGGGSQVDLHGIRVVYAAHVVGGDLRHEVGGSTDMAGWFDLAEVPALPQVPLVAMGLAAAMATDPAAEAARLP